MSVEATPAKLGSRRNECSCEVKMPSRTLNKKESKDRAMRKGYLNRKSIAPLLIALSLAAPGCKSGWKMPSPSSMWPWSRQPSAETLSGASTKPTLESPAAKHTPTAIASSAAGTKPSTSGTPASYGGSSLAASSSPTKPTYGGAASANGYQTGPYGMSGQHSANAGAVAASTGYPSGGYVPPNTYSGSAGLPSSNLPPASTPNVSNPYASTSAPGNTAASMASMSMPPAGAPSPAAQTGYSMPNAMPPTTTSMPSMQPNMPPAAGYAGPTAAAVSFPMPGTSMPSASSGSLPPSSYPGATTSMPGSMPPPAATQTAHTGTSSTPDGYRPGSTARANVYNFSSGSTTVPVNATNPNVPSTAMPSSGYGSFQIPSNTATAPGTIPAPTMR